MFLPISTDFTLTPGIPFTSAVLKPCSFQRKKLPEQKRATDFTVEEQPRDWPTILARRAKKEGWSMFPVYSNGTDMFTPLTHFYIASTCNDFPGWSWVIGRARGAGGSSSHIGTRPSTTSRAF